MGAMQKLVAFYHDNDTDILKIGYTILNLANIYLHKTTDTKFYLFTEGDKEHVGGGPSIVFTRKAVVDECFFRNSTNICKSNAGIDASQLNPYSMCQPMPTSRFAR